MSQTQDKVPWVFTAELNESAENFDPENFATKIQELFEKWQTQGKFLWSGPLDDNKTALTVFEGTNEEASAFFQDYNNAVGDVVTIEKKQWDALPVLSLL